MNLDLFAELPPETPIATAPAPVIAPPPIVRERQACKYCQAWFYLVDWIPARVAGYCCDEHQKKHAPATHDEPAAQ